MTNVVNAAAAIVVIGPFDVVTAHIGRLGAERPLGERCPVRGAAEIDQIGAATLHVVGKLHVIVHGIVEGLDAIGVVHGEFRVVGGLDELIKGAIYNLEKIIRAG
jgi:hypothetical protein